MSRRQARLALLFLAAALVLLVWSGWLVITLPYRYVTTHRHTRKPSLSNLDNERRRSIVMKRLSWASSRSASHSVRSEQPRFSRPLPRPATSKRLREGSTVTRPGGSLLSPDSPWSTGTESLFRS